MSQQLISRNATLKQLRDEGYEVEVRPEPPHLLVHSVPYVNSRREIARGTLVSTLKLAGDITQPPDTHMVHFVGEHPCNVDGTEIAQIKNASESTMSPLDFRWITPFQQAAERRLRQLSREDGDLCHHHFQPGAGD